ncbi:spore germination protein, partial [Micrococcus sp. SIMBA_144]
FIRDGLYLTDDLSIRNLIFNDSRIKLIFIDSIVDVKSVQMNVIKPMQETPFGNIRHIVNGATIIETVDLQKALDGLVDGSCLLIQEDEECMLLIPSPKDQSAHRIEPTNEKVVRGS